MFLFAAVYELTADSRSHDVLSYECLNDVFISGKWMFGLSSFKQNVFVCVYE